MLLIFSPCNNAHENGVMKQTWLRKGEKSIETLWALWIDVETPGTSSYLITFKLKYCVFIVQLQLVKSWVTQFTIWEPFFCLCEYTLHVFHFVGLGRNALNKCHFSVVSSASLLSVDPFKLSIPFSPPLFGCLLFPRAGGFYFTPLSS